MGKGKLEKEREVFQIRPGNGSIIIGSLICISSLTHQWLREMELQ